MNKVLFVYHVSSVGGGSYCLLNILKSINRDYILPVVLLSKEGSLVDEIKKLGITVYFLETLCSVPYNTNLLRYGSLNKIIKITRSKSRFKELLSQICPDTVYFNSMMLYPYLRISKEKGCKTFIHIREHWEAGEHKYQRYHALKTISKYADEIVAINRFSASMIAPFGRDASIIYDWINLSSRYEERPLRDIFDEDMEGKKVFLYTGGMQEIKGAYEVLKAFTSFVKGEEFRLLALGINVDIKYSGIKHFAKSILNLFGIKTYVDLVLKEISEDNRIKCIPGTYNITHLYNQAYCVISYFTIPHANLSLAEAIISESFAIAARTDEALEYSKEGELALLFKMNDFEDFKDKIQSIGEVRDSYINELKKSSREIELLFSPSANIVKLNKLLKNEGNSNL